MKKEIISILVLVAVLILAGWGIGSFLNKNKSPEENIVPEESATSEENIISKEENNIMEPKKMSWDTAPEMQINTEKSYKAVIKTTEGDMEVELFAQDNPITVNNFVFLARKKFYENVKFHRIIKNFMIQGGDPTGTGAGGPGYKFDDELITKDYEKGILAMANAGSNTNGSQFFIMTQDYPLRPNYVIFGKVIEGFDALDKIADTPVEDNGIGEISKPTKDVLIKSIEIIED